MRSASEGDLYLICCVYSGGRQGLYLDGRGRCLDGERSQDNIIISNSFGNTKACTRLAFARTAILI